MNISMNMSNSESDLTMTIEDAVFQRLTMVFDWIKTVQDALPDFASTGFLTSFGMILLTFPCVLILTLYMVWSIASVGPARKTLSTILIIVFGVPVYPILAGLSLAIFWIIASFGTLALAVAGSIFIVSFLVYVLYENVRLYVEHQRELTPVVDDINFGEMLFGLIMGILGMCTFGLLALAMTLLKSPFVFIACICHFVYHTIPPLVRETGCWCPCAFLGWLFAFMAGVVALVLAILVSALVKLLLAGIWPAYVASGWLRYFGGGGRRSDRRCCAPIVEGLKAGYQVFWAADLLTNACIYGDIELLKQCIEEFFFIAIGRRTELSAECRKIACLPPVVVGLFQGSWDISQELLARELGFSFSVVQQAWRSFRQQMSKVLADGISSGQLTRDYILEVPPELVIGLPARVLLDTVERSPEDEIVLASGLVITETDIPERNDFAKKVWDDLQAAIRARAKLQLTVEQRLCLCGALLGGGGDPSEMPPGLAKLVREFDALPLAVRDQCVIVQQRLIAVALDCSRESSFKNELENVIQSVGQDQEEGAALIEPSDGQHSEDEEESDEEDEEIEHARQRCAIL